MTSTFKLYKEIESKSELLLVEQHFLLQREKLTNIGELLIGWDKCHVDAEEALKLIREELKR